MASRIVLGMGRGTPLAQRLSLVHRASLGTTATSSSGPVEGLCASARSQLEALYKADWTTVDEEDVAGLESILAKYRPFHETASSEQQQLMAEVYAARHASVITTLFAEHVRWTMRQNLYSTGWLGEPRKPKQEVHDDAVNALEDYPKFIDSIEPDRVRHKVASELGVKMVQLRQTLQVPQYSSKFSAVATDHIVTRDY